MNLPFKNDEFDRIVSVAVLQHIPSAAYRQQFLKECLRTLKKDGKLILTVWLVKNGSKYYYSIYNMVNRIKSLLNISKMDFNDLFIPFKTNNSDELINRYVHAFSLGELKQLVTNVGFKIEDCGYTTDNNNKKRNLYIVASKK